MAARLVRDPGRETFCCQYRPPQAKAISPMRPSVCLSSRVFVIPIAMDRLAQDLRYAIRKLSAAPTFTLAAVATLAIGIGATTATFSTVHATLLRPLPSSPPDELTALPPR